MLLAATVLLACSGKPDTDGRPQPTAEQPQEGVVAHPAANTPQRVKGPSPPTLVPGPVIGNVDEVVAKHLQAANADGRWLVVYVGAEWCAPCRAFRNAVLAGTLNTELVGITFLEFDADRDRDRLKPAGYHSRMIPLLAVPNPDGTSSTLRSEGGIKGPKAAAFVAKKLIRLLRRHPTKPYVTRTKPD